MTTEVFHSIAVQILQISFTSRSTRSELVATEWFVTHKEYPSVGVKTVNVWFLVSVQLKVKLSTVQLKVLLSSLVVVRPH